MIEVHFEAKFNRRQVQMGNILPPSDVVIKRGSFLAESDAHAEKLCATEGQKIFEGYPEAAAGCNQRMEIIGLNFLGVLHKPPHPVAVAMKTTESA